MPNIYSSCIESLYILGIRHFLLSALKIPDDEQIKALLNREGKLLRKFPSCCVRRAVGRLLLARRQLLNFKQAKKMHPKGRTFPKQCFEC